MERRIVHMDLDSFFVSVECLQNNSLIGKPVIIGGESDRGVVASCSYEARQFGVHSAMSSKIAKRLCPHAIFVKGNMALYAKYSGMVTAIIADSAPMVEKASIDEHYLDLTGMDQYIKHSMLFTQELRQRIIKQAGLPISFGLSANKTVSKMATNEAKPNGELQIATGQEKAFLAPLSIKKIPGIGDKTYSLLRNMGIEKIETVQQMPVEAMAKALGESGYVIWKKANGIDNRPVEPHGERTSMSTETTFNKDTTDTDKLKDVLTGMVDKLAFDLRKAGQLTGCVTLKLRYSDFETHTFQSRVAYTAADHVLIEKTLELFQKNYSRKVLIRLIAVKFSSLIWGSQQVNLFDDSEEKMKLYQAMDKIRLRFGNKAIVRASSLRKKKDN